MPRIAGYFGFRVSLCPTTVTIRFHRVHAVRDSLAWVKRVRRALAPAARGN